MIASLVNTFLILFIMLSPGLITGQTVVCTDFQCDSTTVRNILDAKGLQHVTVTSVIHKIDERVVGLIIHDSLGAIPPEIAKLE